MSGVSDLFAIGSAGVRVYRAAMGAVSENIANATTEGYNRRAVIMQESPTSATTSQFYKPGVSFGGVEVQQISRSDDQYLDLAARIASGNYEDASTRDKWLSDVQSALDDSELGVGQKLGTMFAAVERLASNPTDTTLRQNVLFAFEQINTSFKQAYDGLQNVKSGIGSTAQNATVALNDAIAQVASANEGLRRAVPGSSNAAQLQDQRDLGLANISKYVDSTVTFGDHGVANITYNGTAMVAGIHPSTFAVSSNADGTLAFTLNGTSVATPTTGSLAGLADSAVVVAQRVTTLNSLANQYVTDVNTWHKAGFTAVSPTPVPGGDMLSIGADASTLHVLISDPTQIAGMSADGKINGNLLAATNLRGGTGVEAGWTSLIAAHSNLLNATKTEATAMSARNQQAQNARGDVSGVDLDREAADLLRLQQIYQGCARIISIARETSQYVFDAVG